MHFRNDNTQSEMKRRITALIMAVTLSVTSLSGSLPQVFALDDLAQANVGEQVEAQVKESEGSDELLIPDEQEQGPGQAEASSSPQQG